MNKQEQKLENEPKELRGKEQKPLSDTIKNAHAAGDGALGRSLDSTIEPGEERTDRSSEESRKGPEQY